MAAPVSFAQTPHAINYAGRLVGEDVPATGSHSIAFTLFGSAEGGSPLWTETHEVEVTDGLFNVLLGSSNELPLSLIRDHDELYLSIAVDGGAEMRPRLFVASTVFSLRSALADDVRDGAIGTAHLVDGSITSAKIAEDAVTTSKLVDRSVTGAKLTDGSVTGAKLDPGAAVTSLNDIRGAVELVAGVGISIEEEGRQITIAIAPRSSIRWKRNVQPLRNALDTVERLRGVSYEWKDSGENDIGLIAEEVGAVLPEIVEFEDDGRYAKSVQYSRLVAVLIEAVKEQQDQIDARDEAIEQLMTRVERLERTQGNAVSIDGE